MMLGRIEFAPCDGCRTPSECVPHQQCLPPMERGTVERFRFMRVPQGWECPRCRVIHAPQVLHCTCTSHAHGYPRYQD